MPSDDHADERVTAARLSAIGFAPARGWVPDQSAYGFTNAAPTPPTATPPTATPPPHSPSAEPFHQRWTAWFDEVAVAASGRALMGLTAVCLGCVAVTAWVLLHHRAGPGPLAPTPFAMPAQPLPSASPVGLVVDVGGRVRHPGLVTLPQGSRVADAVQAAGGAVRPRDLRFLNLAARVADGQLLLVGVSAAPMGGSTDPGASTGPVNLNSATVDQLDTLPGIGPVLAQRIIDWRTQHGTFQTVADLNEVSGIGDTIFAELQPLVTV